MISMEQVSDVREVRELNGLRFELLTKLVISTELGSFPIFSPLNI